MLERQLHQDFKVDRWWLLCKFEEAVGLEELLRISDRPESRVVVASEGANECEEFVVMLLEERLVRSYNRMAYKHDYLAKLRLWIIGRSRT